MYRKNEHRQHGRLDDLVAAARAASERVPRKVFIDGPAAANSGGASVGPGRDVRGRA
jgi:hypothetical protein